MSKTSNRRRNTRSRISITGEMSIPGGPISFRLVPRLAARKIRKACFPARSTCLAGVGNRRPGSAAASGRDRRTAAAEEPMVRRLFAGGNRIRTIGPALVKGLSAVAEERCRTDKRDGVILSTGRLARRRWSAAGPLSTAVSFSAGPLVRIRFPPPMSPFYRADSEYRPSITPSPFGVGPVRDLSCGDSVRHRETFASHLAPLGRTTYVAARVHKLG